MKLRSCHVLVLLLLVIAGISPLIEGCNDDPEPPHPLTGTWKIEVDENTTLLFPMLVVPQEIVIDEIGNCRISATSSVSQVLNRESLYYIYFPPPWGEGWMVKGLWVDSLKDNIMMGRAPLPKETIGAEGLEFFAVWRGIRK